eukprot:gene1628-1807_t
MFCPKCGAWMGGDLAALFCCKCGQNLPSSSSPSTSNSQFREGKNTPTELTATQSALQGARGQLPRKETPSFHAYRKTKGKEWKSRVSTPKEDKPLDVIITIGLLEWSAIEQKLKAKRGQRLALRVSTIDPCGTILEKAQKKWKDYQPDSYTETEYVLTYPNGKSARFMPGTFEFFNLKWYKEEIGKEYKRLVFYLCTPDDYLVSENSLEDFYETPAKKQSNDDLDVYDFLTEETQFVGNISDELNLLTTPTAIPTTPTTTQAGSSKQGDDEVQASMHNQCEKMDTKSFQEEVKQLGKLFQEGVESTLVPAIRRRKIWLDTTFKLKRAFENGIKPFTVQFIGEEVVDAGGPQKEFFTVLFEDVKRYLLCSGDGVTYMFLHDIEKLQNCDSHMFGTLVGLALLQECSGPRYFMPCVVAKMLNAPPIKPNRENLPDYEVKEKLDELLSAEDEEDFQGMMNAFTERFSFGITKSTVKMGEREQFAENITQHFCLSACHEEMQDFRKGLDVHGLLRILENNYEESKSEFLIPKSQTASEVLLLFKVLNFTKTDGGDGKSIGRRELEEDIYFNFTNLVETLEHRGHIEVNTIEIDDKGGGKESTRKISVEDVIQFCTGSKYVTPALKGTGTLNFDHSGKYGALVANTCSVLLTFPVIDRYTKSAEDFVTQVVNDICSQNGFGMV